MPLTMSSISHPSVRRTCAYPTTLGLDEWRSYFRDTANAGLRLEAILNDIAPPPCKGDIGHPTLVPLTCLPYHGKSSSHRPSTRPRISIRSVSTITVDSRCAVALGCQHRYPTPCLSTVETILTHSHTDGSPEIHIPESTTDFSHIQPDKEPTASHTIVTIPILGGTAYISESGVTLSRCPAAQVYLAAETNIDRDSIRGWSITPPTTLQPGFIDLYLDNTPATPRQSARFTPHALRFPPTTSSDSSIIDCAVDALTAMQADDQEGLRRIAYTMNTSGITAHNSSDGSDDGGQLEMPVETRSTPKGVSPSDSYPPSFIAFDVETANEAHGSICQFGIVVFRDGEETESHTWLCQPPSTWSEFTPATVAIHGINADHVAEEPTCRDRLEQFSALLRKEQLPLVAHNAKFDMTALRDAARAENVDLPDITFVCTYLLARALRPGLPNYKLTTVAHAAGSRAFRHHDALADARACGDIMLNLCGVSPHCRESSHSAYEDIDSASRHLSLTEVVDSAGYTFGTVRDQSITLCRKPRTSRSELSRTSRRGHVQGKRNEDTRGTTHWEAVATPRDVPETNTDADTDGPLFGHNVTLTGEFSPLDKGQLWQAIAQAGGIVGKNVTKKTTLLVCGDWNGTTSKQKRAEELKEKGQKIDIWNQAQLLEALDLN